MHRVWLHLAGCIPGLEVGGILVGRTRTSIRECERVRHGRRSDLGAISAPCSAQS